MNIAITEQGGVEHSAAPAKAPVEPERLATAPLLALLVLVPLPFASNRPWSWSLLSLAVGLILLVWSWKSLQARRPIPVAPRRIWPSIALYLLVCLYAAVQVVPGMPADIANPFWRLLDDLGEPARGSISIAPEETLTALMRLIAYGATFFLFLQVGRSPERAGRCFAWIAGVTAFYSAYGLTVEFGRFGTILWFDKWAYEDSLTSTFVNRNSFATYAGMGLLCALALLIRQFLRGGGRITMTRRGIADLIGRFDPATVFALACLLINLMALLLTDSRAGTAATLGAALLFLVGLGFAAGRRKGPSVALGAIFLAVVGYYVALGGDGLMARAASLVGDGGLADEARVHAYADMLRAIETFGLYGIGYGGFEDFFKIYRSPDVLVYFDKAHSTYLENALELGVPATAALVVAIGLVALRCLMALRRRSSSFVFGWAAFAATLLVGLHAVVDFSLQMPAVAVTYAALLGIGCAQSWSRRERTARIRRESLLQDR